MAAAEMVGKNRTVFATDIHPVAIEHIQKSASKRGYKNIKTILMADNTGADKVDKGDISRENIFQIMDGIITQLNKTKKMFIIMILTMILPPIAFALTFALFGPPFHFNEDRGLIERFDDVPHIPPQIALARIVPILISLIWLGIGIRQWFVLSKWSKKYERYKELQKRIDEKLDYGNNGVEDKRKDRKVQ